MQELEKMIAAGLPSRFGTPGASKSTKRNHNPFKNRDWGRERKFIDYDEIPDEPYIDSHCHFDYIRFRFLNESEWFNTWEQLKSYFVRTPVNFSGCIWNLVHPYYLRKGVSWIPKMIKEKEVLGVAVGCHPHFVNEWDQFKLHDDEPLPQMKQQSMRDWVLYMVKWRKFNKVVAIGECGLDTSKLGFDMDTQLRVFLEQLGIAKQWKLPVVIHCRGDLRTEALCLDSIVKILGSYAVVHRHCFREGPHVARMWMNKLPNCSFGFTPAIVNGKESEKESLRMIPLSKILLETDSPFFPTETHQKVPTAVGCKPFTCGYPAEANVVAHMIAELKENGLTTSQVLSATKLNTERLYNLDTVLSLRNES